MCPQPMIGVPAGRRLKATLTYNELPELRRHSTTNEPRVTYGAQKQSDDGSDVAVILVTPTEEQNGFEAQFLISERKIRTLLMDAIRWYVADDVTFNNLHLIALTEGELPHGTINVYVPDELISMRRLVEVTSSLPPASPSPAEGCDKVVGWVLVLAALVAILASLYMLM